MKIVRLAIFLTGIMGLAMGGVTVVSSMKTNQEEALLRTHENLKSLATQFVGQFFQSLETAKNLSANQAANSVAPLTPSFATHRAILNLKDGQPAEFENFTALSPPSDGQAQVDYPLQERLLSSLKVNLSMGDLKILKVAYGTYSLSDISNKEGIFVATPIYKTTSGLGDKAVIDPSVIEKVGITLIDPVKAMASLTKVIDGDQNAYLFDKNGKVLAHSLPAFVGTDLKKISGLKESIENLFLGAQTGSVDQYSNLEGSKEIVATVRAGTSPFAFAVEERAKPSVLSSQWISETISSGMGRKNIGVAMMMIAIAMVCFSGISIVTTRELKKQIELGETSRGATALEAAAAPSFSSSSLSSSIAARLAPSAAQPEALTSIEKTTPIEKATDDFVELRAQLNETKTIAQEQSKLLQFEEYSKRLRKSYTAEGIEKELVNFCSELAGSPVLYFRYQRRTQSLSLGSVAGEVNIENYNDMQVYIRKDIELQVEQLAEQGKVAAVTNYAPLNKLIVSRLNMGQFGAWAVTTSSEISGLAKLVGVLVILQTGPKAAQAKPMIAKVLKESGNYLFAVMSKLKPKASASRPDPEIESQIETYVGEIGPRINS